MRWALVTGSSRGLGAAFVRCLSKEGVNVMGLSRNGPTGSIPYAADITDEESVKAAAAEFAKHSQSLDLIINNAGMMHPSGKGEGAISRITAADMEAVFKLNVIAPALVVKHFLPLLKKGESPAVVNVAAGVASLEGNAAGGWYSYRASKTALNQLTKTMGLELARSNIRCVGLYPRMVDTDLSKAYQKANPYGVLRSPDEAADKMLATLAQVELKPVGRFIDIWEEKDIPW